MQELIDKANVLIEALPYIQKFSGKTIVVKYGGNAMKTEELRNRVIEDITLMKFIGLCPVVIHGGGPDINEELGRRNIETRFSKSGLRITDKATMDVAQMVLTGRTNKDIVALMNAKGGKGVGFCGIDGNLIECEKYTADEEDLGYVGNITNINPYILEILTKDNFIPVIAPIGVDRNGNSYNINADTAASAIAVALKAEKLILLTDVDGVKANGSILHFLNKGSIEKYIADGTISGGMIPKVMGALDAILQGVSSVHIINGTIPHCLLLEIFTDSGIGTMITL